MEHLSPNRSLPSHQRGRAATETALGLCVFIFASALSLTEIRSLDYWWHLRTGQLILESGLVPLFDTYTYTVPGARWIDTHWFFQCMLYGVWWLGGHSGVALAQWLSVLLLVGIVGATGSRCDRPGVTALGVSLVLLLSCQRFMPRPEPMSMILLAAMLWCFDRHQRTGDRRALYCVVPIQLLWANVHGLFALGVAVCGIHLAAELLRGLRAGRVDWAESYRLGGVALLAAAVSFLTPNGLDAVLFPLEQLRMITVDAGAQAPWVTEIGRLLAEGGVPALRIGVTLGAALLTLAVMVLNWKRLRVADPLIWGALLFLTLSAHRNQALFSVACATILVRNLHDLLDAHPLPAWAGRLGAATLCGALLAGSAGAITGDLFEALGDPRRSGFGLDRQLHSAGAVDRILSDAPEGPIYHHMADGGFLIWHLYPERKVMIDGRLEVFGAEEFARLNRGDPAGFRKLDDQYGFGTALLNYHVNFYEPLIGALYHDPAWQLVYVDETAALFYRSGPVSAGLDVEAPSLFPPLPSDTKRARSRVIHRLRFFIAIRRPDLALREWGAFQTRSPEAEEEPLLAITMLLGTGQRAEAHRRLVDLERASLNDPDALQQAAQLYAAAGDAVGAQRATARAYALDPARERANGRPTPRARDAILRRKAQEERLVLAELVVPTAIGVALAFIAAGPRRVNV